MRGGPYDSKNRDCFILAGSKVHDFNQQSFTGNFWFLHNCIIMKYFVSSPMFKCNLFHTFLPIFFRYFYSISHSNDFFFRWIIKIWQRRRGGGGFNPDYLELFFFTNLKKNAIYKNVLSYKIKRYVGWRTSICFIEPTFISICLISGSYLSLTAKKWWNTCIWSFKSILLQSHTFIN